MVRLPRARKILFLAAFFTLKTLARPAADRSRTVHGSDDARRARHTQMQLHLPMLHCPMPSFICTKHCAMHMAVQALPSQAGARSAGVARSGGTARSGG